MGDTSIAGLPHFLDRDGLIAESQAGSRIANLFAAIVAAVTESPSVSPRETSIRCWGQPRCQACPGDHPGPFDPGTSRIYWLYSICNDQGWIHGWQGVRWDKGSRIGLPASTGLRVREL